MRLFPNMVVHGPRRRARRARRCCDFALAHDGPVVDALSRRRTSRRSSARVAPIELGQAEVLEWGDDGMLRRLRHAARRPASRRPRSCASEGLDVGVINARFVKPLDRETILRAVETCRWS